MVVSEGLEGKRDDMVSDDDERKKRNGRGALVDWSGEMGVIYLMLGCWEPMLRRDLIPWNI